jgi:hypothetical protein
MGSRGATVPTIAGHSLGGKGSRPPSLAFTFSAPASKEEDREKRLQGLYLRRLWFFADSRTKGIALAGGTRNMVQPFTRQSVSRDAQAKSRRSVRTPDACRNQPPAKFDLSSWVTSLWTLWSWGFPSLLSHPMAGTCSTKSVCAAIGSLRSLSERSMVHARSHPSSA